MSERHPHRATIPVVSDEMHRPLWSVMIPTYNCAYYLRETLASILAQDLGPECMQIEVIDDHSTHDDPASVVEELGRGRVSFYRQPKNVGHTRNFETCLKRARGELVHLLHGDDCVRDGFYRKMQCAFDEHLELGAAFCRHLFIDEYGHWQRISPLEQLESGILNNWLERIVAQQRIQTPAMVVRRAVYERLGGFDRRMFYSCEDWEMWVRIAANYPVWYEVEPLAMYRMHSASLTGHAMQTGADVRDAQTAIEIIQSYLPEHLPPVIAAELVNEAREEVALGVLSTAHDMFIKGNLISGLAQTREALRCNRSLRVMGRLIRLVLGVGIRWTHKTVY